MKYIDTLLDKITMYRTVIYVLFGYLGIAGVLSVVGWMSFSFGALFFTSVFIFIVCYGVNYALAWYFKAHSNFESVLITALILACIIQPTNPTSLSTLAFPFFASVIAMASKYVIAYRHKHILNPAAVGILLASYPLQSYASWWIGGNEQMLIPLLIGGFLVVRKIKRFDMVIAFSLTAVAGILAVAGDVTSALAYKAFVHTSLIFFAGIMLTEPLTTPPHRGERIVYGVLAGALFIPSWHIYGIHSSPELALCLVNIFSFIISPKGRFVLTLKKITLTSDTSSEFVFSRSDQFTFTPGQYMEWTLPHAKPDSRGIRRYFTIASAPEEKDVRIGVKFYEKPSTFKLALAHLRPGETLSATGIAGDFILPRDEDRKVAFIAGGIGITPFVSMLSRAIKKEERRNMVLLYANRTDADVAYKELLKKAAEKIGLKYEIFSDSENTKYRTGRINKESIISSIPDFAERIFYVSGSQGLVDSATDELRKAGVLNAQIRKDFFPSLT